MTPENAQSLQVILVASALVVGAVAAFLWWRLRPNIILVGGPSQGDEAPSASVPATAFTVTSPRAAAPEAPPAPAIKLAPLEAVVRQLLQTTPHVGIIGDSGAGKTTTGEAMIRLLAGEGFVADPKWWQGKWGGLPAAGLDDDAGYSQIAAGLQALFVEFNRRRIYKRDNPEATFTDLWLIWDEINDTMEELPEAGVHLRRLLRVGREYNVHVLFFPQSDRVKALGLEGHGDAVKNVLWMYLGNDARELVKRLVRDGKLDATTGQYLIGLERPAVVGHGGQYYAVSLATAPLLAQRPVTSLKGWQVPGPRSEAEKTTNSTLGPADLSLENPSKKWPEIRESAVRNWIREGLSDTAIALKIDMRKEDARAMVKDIRAAMDKAHEEKALQPQSQGEAIPTAKAA